MDGAGVAEKECARLCHKVSAKCIKLEHGVPKSNRRRNDAKEAL